MEGTMRAMVLEAPKKLVLKEVPIPKPGPRDVLLKTKYAGVCGSDFPIYNEGLFVPRLPIIIGHEASAVIVEKGDLVEGFEVGDRVTGTNIQFCGQCPACKATPAGELAWGCGGITTTGLGFGVPGVFAEYFMIYDVIPNVSLIKIPDNVNDLDAATIEPMSTGAGWTEIPNPQPGDKIVITGAGIIAQSVLQQLLQIPDIETVVIDYSDLRLSLAKKMGATHIVNPAKDGDPVEYVINLWGNREFMYNYGNKISGNADIVYECSGNEKAWTQAIQMTKPMGKMASIGTVRGISEIAPQWIQLKMVQLFGGLHGSMHKSAQMLGEKKLHVEDLVTHVFPLEKAVEAFELAQQPDKSMKIMIKVDESAPDYPYNKLD